MYVCVCVNVLQCVHMCTPVEDRTTSRSLFSFSVTWVLGIQVVRLGAECLYLGLGLLRSNLTMMVCFFFFSPDLFFFHFFVMFKIF